MVWGLSSDFCVRVSVCLQVSLQYKFEVIDDDLSNCKLFVEWSRAPNQNTVRVGMKMPPLKLQVLNSDKVATSLTNRWSDIQEIKNRLEVGGAA